MPARFQSSSQRQQPQPGGVPMPAGLSRRDSNRYPGAAAPLTNQYPHSQYPHSFPSPTMQTQYPTTGVQPQYPTAGVQPQYPAAAAQPQYPSNSQYPQGDDWSRGVQSSYMDEMRFTPKETSVEPTSSTLNRKARSTGKGRFSNRVNRSSSLHDLARARLDSSEQPDGGVKWKDEQKLPNIGMPGLGVI